MGVDPKSPGPWLAATEALAERAVGAELRLVVVVLVPFDSLPHGRTMCALECGLVSSGWGADWCPIQTQERCRPLSVPQQHCGTGAGRVGSGDAC